MTMLRMVISVFILLLLSKGNSSAQKWKENTGIERDYDLSKIRVLTIVYEGYNYEEAIEITNYWKKWGAKVDLAGTLMEQHGERNNPATGKVHDEIPTTLKPDLLFKDANYRKYDLIYFPGGEGVAEFLKTYRDKLQEIIDGSVEGRKYVAAICHAPYILSASQLLKNHSVTVQGNEFKSELNKSGAKIVNEIFVSDGYFLTGQWPYFETFSASVAEKLQYPLGGGPLETAKKNSSPVLNGLLDQKNAFLMKPGTISDDTIAMMIRHSVNPILPFDMMNNPYIKYIAVKDPYTKSRLIDQLTESSKEKYKSQNIPPESMKRLWTLIFNAPVVIFIYNDLTETENIMDLQDKENQLKINTLLAGQSISQLNVAAKELGFSISVIGGLRSLIAEEGFNKVLEVPSNYQLLNIIGIGHPVETMNPAVARPVNEYLIIK
jgi:putative intracellular protease/amidase